MPGRSIEGTLLLSIVRYFVGNPSTPHFDADAVDLVRLSRLATLHGLAPVLHKVLSDSSLGPIPVSVLADLWASSEVNTRRNQRRAAELIRLLRLFDEAGLRCVPFKGPVLTAALYGDLGLREFADLDILVRRDDVLAAKRVCEQAGYQQLNAIRAEHEEAFVAASRQYDFELVHAETRDMVELHWKTNREFAVESMNDPQWWLSLDKVDVGGDRLDSLNLREMMFTLLIHGSKHLWSRLSWVVDIALLTRRLSDADWDWLVGQAVTQRCRRRIGLGLAVATNLLGCQLPPRTAMALCDDPTVRRVAGFVESQAFARTGARPLNTVDEIRLDLQLYDTVWQRARCMSQLVFTSNALGWGDRGTGLASRASGTLRRWRYLLKKYVWR